jgi:hypothetical protein
VASSFGASTRRSTSAGSRTRIAAAAALLLFLPSVPARAQRAFRAELFGGTSWSAPSTLTIDQSGLDRLSQHAHWETRPLDESPYYAARIGLWSGRAGWELQLIHHKIYLTNETAEIPHFEVSHGWNLVTMQRAIRGRFFEWRFGVGAVVAYPEGSVRGRDADTDAYHLAGTSALIGIGKRFEISRRFFAGVEAQATYSFARIPIETGHARTRNLALHALAGVGIAL